MSLGSGRFLSNITPSTSLTLSPSYPGATTQTHANMTRALCWRRCAYVSVCVCARGHFGLCYLTCRFHNVNESRCLCPALVTLPLTTACAVWTADTNQWQNRAKSPSGLAASAHMFVTHCRLAAHGLREAAMHGPHVCAPVSLTCTHPS